MPFLGEAASAAFHAAVETIETASSVEVVVAVRPHARRWLAPHAGVGALVATAMLAYVMFAETEFEDWVIFVLPVVSGLVGALIVEAFGPVYRLLVPARHHDEHVREAARAEFYERGVHGTHRRTGMLVFVALRERQVELVGDVALVARVGQAQLDTWSDAIATQLRHGGVATADALAKLAIDLGVALPHHAGDINELPDEVSTIHPHRSAS
jgi:uncharacterized membrane protein